MRIIFIALAVILVASRSYAQVKQPEATHFSLRTSLLAPLEADANVMLGLGIQWQPRWAAILDVGYIFTNSYDNNFGAGNERDRISGFKLRSELRYYLKELSYSGKTTFYMAPVFHYKKVTAKRWEEFGMDCVNGNCNYFQIDTYKRIKQEFGGLFTAGAFSPLFGGNRVALETFIGLGIKVKKYKNTDFPPGSTQFVPAGGGVLSFDSDGVFPMFPVGVMLSFRLN